MSERFINITLENLESEHICCAIADKKHQFGFGVKRQWLKERIPEGRVFRKLDERGKNFIEYCINDARKKGKSGICNLIREGQVNESKIKD
ncbi:hypothetical protein [Proteocatella sphenisci]|uniref:hypothetical protein n=1 Tax=Proteocatella sphenisci TaxID=181070 RepID=UPI00048CDAD7|nr:hypothetical protein [Proteocatella sphenisci]